MDEKRCEWCGTLSPADAEKCTLCRIPFGAPVPPPQDWSHLTGNIPVVTAPLLETPVVQPVVQPASQPALQSAAEPASPPALAEPVEALPGPVVPQQVQREVQVPEPVRAEGATARVTERQAAERQPAPEPAPVAAGFAARAAEPAQDVVPSVGEMVVSVATGAPQRGDAAVPGWRPPDDPTLRVFADRLEERERRRSGSGAASARRGRRRRRQLVRLLVWLVAIGLIAAFVLLAPARLPGF